MKSKKKDVTERGANPQEGEMTCKINTGSGPRDGK